MSKHEYVLAKRTVHAAKAIPVYDPTTPIQIPDILDMAPQCSPMEDQETLGACTGNAIAGLMEYLENIEGQEPVRLSRLYVYFNERMQEGTINSDAGADIHDGIYAIATWGMCDERIWPYDITKFRIEPSADAYIDGATRRAIDYHMVEQTEDALLHCLASKRPVVFGIVVYESFESDEVAKTGIVPMPAPHEKSLGGHAVLIVGYNRTTRMFKVRNSWGSSWGQQGYFELPFDYVLDPDLADSFWTVTKKL
jgi:C1A family cysteine protease